MEDISKFNDKYLKCIVTKYLSSINYLGNSGSLIVYQPASGSQINRNYIYLGNEFLASGYGFSDQDTQIKAENIVKKYDDDLQKLSNVDSALGKRITNEINNVLEELKKYIVTNGGSIENTNITINGKTINTKDIILYGEEAQYKNLEVNNITVYINDIELKDNVIFLPIGLSISKIDVIIEYLINDSGGIDRLQVDQNNSTTIVDYNSFNPNINNKYNVNIGTIHFQKTFTNDEIIVNKYLENIISEFFIWVKPTPIAEYKTYPQLEQNLGIKIISSGNAIKENFISIIKHINVRPQFYMYYGYSYTEENLCKFKKPLNSFIDYDKTSLILNLDDFDYNKNKQIYVSLPSKFILRKLYLVNKYNEHYDLTGLLVVHNNEYLPVIYNQDTSKSKYILYDIYKLEISKLFDDDIKLEVDIIYNSQKDQSNIDADYYNDVISSEISLMQFAQNHQLSNFSNNSYHINDENFNNLYWITYDENYNYKVDINNDSTNKETYFKTFKNMLTEMSYNGIIKNKNNE